MLSKKDLTHLAELARIELDPKNEEKLLVDLENILRHFEELKNADTSGVKPMDGGTLLKNIYRADEEAILSRERAVRAFPKTKEGFLEVPPVFE